MAYNEGRPQAGIERRWQAVRKILRPLARSPAPTGFDAGNDMIQSSRAIPWLSDIPFHVRILGEHFTVAVEGHVKLIAETSGDDFPVFPVGIRLHNMPHANVQHSVSRFGQQMVVLWISIGRIGRETFRKRHVVAVDNIQHVVRSQFNLVGSVTIATLIIKRFEFLHGIQLIITVGVAQPIEASGVGRNHVQTVVCPQNSETMLQRVVVDFKTIHAATIVAQ